MNKKPIETHDDCLIVPNRQLSFIVAALLFIGFFIFTLGYFLGTKHATDEFVAQINQETFADQIFASVHTQSHQPATAQAETLPCECPSDPAPTIAHQNTSTNTAPASNTAYAAELIGFGTQKAAQHFIDRVAKISDITLELRTRTYTNSRKKETTWYQVVTKRYANKEELENALAMITKTEKLHDINIVSC